MAQILVEEDWGREADENPFPSGGGGGQYRRGTDLCLCKSASTPSPLQSVEELNKQKSRQEIFKKKREKNQNKTKIERKTKQKNENFASTKLKPMRMK